MVSAVWAFVAFQVGLLVAIALPVVGPLVAIDLRKAISNRYYSWAETCLGPSAIVWRRLGRPTLKPISIDDEREVAEVVQSSGTLSDDQKLPFRDPADAKQPLFSKQWMVVPEGIPAAVDAQMAELAHWFDAKASRDGLETEGGRIDPWVPMSNQPRSVDPLDVVAALDTDTTPEDVKTTERHTRARFAKYGGVPSLKEGGAMLVSFGVGAGVVMGAVYLRDEVIADGASGGGGGSIPIPPGMATTDVLLQTLPVII
jgi:hypothetical protein